MEYSIFYSWQSDAPDKCNRMFVRNALDTAVLEIGQNLEVVDSPRVESGMEGVAGTQEVAQTMFDKIDRSDIFIADVTLVGKIKAPKKGKKGKLAPNPNVMTELGYAAARMGWKRIICVINEHYGSRQNLPFDIRSKRHPIDYVINPSKMENSEKIQKDLKKWIVKAIKICSEEEHAGVKYAISKLDIFCLIVCSVYRNMAYFRDLGQDEQNRNALSSIIGLLEFRLAVLRLLDLQLLSTDAHSRLYAYHWTHRGKLLLKELEKRNQLQPIIQAVQTSPD